MTADGDPQAALTIAREALEAEKERVLDLIAGWARVHAQDYTRDASRVVHRHIRRLDEIDAALDRMKETP